MVWRLVYAHPDTLCYAIVKISECWLFATSSKCVYRWHIYVNTIEIKNISNYLASPMICKEHYLLKLCRMLSTLLSCIIKLFRVIADFQNCKIFGIWWLARFLIASWTTLSYSTDKILNKTTIFTNVIDLRMKVSKY